MIKKDSLVIINVALIFYISFSYIILKFYPISALYPLLVIFTFSSPFIVIVSIFLLHTYIKNKSRYDKLVFGYKICLGFILFILSMIPLIALIMLISGGLT